MAATNSNDLPRVPQGYYIKPCPNPSTMCNGWHCYADNEEQAFDAGFDRPSGKCDVNNGLTRQWLAGKLIDWPGR